MKRLLTIAAAVLLAAGCDLLNEPGDYEPEGTPFTLNPAVTLVRVVGAAPGWNPNGWTTIGFEISGDSTTWVETLPGGLFFKTKDDEVQNIILLKRHIIRGLPRDTVLPVGGFCVNLSRHLPDEEDTFELGPVTENDDFRRLIDAVADRDIRYCAWLQTAVWEVSEEGKLSGYWLDSIAALPPDTGGLAPLRLPDRRAEKAAGRRAR
ncbi:MAG: hypothetical protein R6X13_00730 [bacterium]